MPTSRPMWKSTPEAAKVAQVARFCRRRMRHLPGDASFSSLPKESCAMKPHRSHPTVLVLLAAFLAATPLAAQEIDDDEIALQSGARQQAFEALAADVESLERQGNILKRVVRYVKPAVVHIE